MLKFSRPIKRLRLSDVAPPVEEKRIIEIGKAVRPLITEPIRIHAVPHSEFVDGYWNVSVGCFHLQRFYENILVEEAFQKLLSYLRASTDVEVADFLLEPEPKPFTPVDFVTLGSSSEGWLFSRSAGGHGFISNEPFAFTVTPREDGEKTPITGCSFTRGVLVKGWEHCVWGNDNVVHGPFLRYDTAGNIIP